MIGPVDAISDLDGCRFCDILQGRSTAGPRAFDDGRFAVIMGRHQPTGPGYSLIIPYAHVPDLHALPDSECGPVLQLVRRVSIAVQQTFDVSGTTVLLNNGPPGQSVAHLHIHVIPRWSGDGYPRRTEATESDAALQSQAAELRAALT
jgi:histidine triad (HIT) family protein